MTCPRCGKENEGEAVFCSKCGLDLSQAKATEPDSTDDLIPCAKHPREMTRLRCGKCDKPICTKCLVMSPAGVRCKECSKTNVEFRPAGLLHSITSSFRGLGRMSPWLLIIMIGMVLGALRGCWYAMQNQNQPYDPAYEQSEKAPPE